MLNFQRVKHALNYKKKTAVDFLPFSALFHLPIPPSPWAPHDLQLPALFVVRTLDLSSFACSSTHRSWKIFFCSACCDSTWMASWQFKPCWPMVELRWCCWSNQWIPQVCCSTFSTICFIFSNLCEDVPVLTEARPWLKNYRDPIPTQSHRFSNQVACLASAAHASRLWYCPARQSTWQWCTLRWFYSGSMVLYGDFMVLDGDFTVVSWYLMTILQWIYDDLMGLTNKK